MGSTFKANYKISLQTCSQITVTHVCSEKISTTFTPNTVIKVSNKPPFRVNKFLLIPKLQVLHAQDDPRKSSHNKLITRELEFLSPLALHFILWFFQDNVTAAFIVSVQPLCLKFIIMTRFFFLFYFK